ncbi:MAG: PDZ domain-containing protein [Gaiella sp.]
MRRLLTPLALVAGLVVAGLFAFGLLVPSGDYFYLPNTARNVSQAVTIDDRPDRSDERGGIYVVDVTVREATWLERLVPFLRPDGSTLVPGHAVTARGESFEQRQVKARAEMERSERVASAVAMQEAGLDVVATPRGVIVAAVAPDVPAAKTLEEGDVIVAAAGRPVKTPAALRDAMGGVEPGETVALRAERSGKVLDLDVQTVPSPEDPRRSLIGIEIGQEADIRLPVDVSIDLGEVGGPSAGLPFALEVLQELGEDVDRGYRVAATGEIELDGTVGPVGGLKQKTLGVKAADADVFLVPAGENAAVARRYAGELRVIPVDSFQQALSALRSLPPK